MRNIISREQLEPFDFLDFGSSSGDSLEFATQRLGGRRGLGVDFDPKKVQAARDRGLDAIQASLIDLECPEDCVDFVLVSHLLEHPWDMTQARQVVPTRARWTS